MGHQPQYSLMPQAGHWHDTAHIMQHRPLCYCIYCLCLRLDLLVESKCVKGPFERKLDHLACFFARCDSLELFAQGISCISWAGGWPWGGASCLCDGALKA